MDSLVLHGLIRELAPRLAGTRILEARRVDRQRLVLDLSGGGSPALVVVAAKELTTLFVADRERANAAESNRGTGARRGRAAYDRGIRGADIASLSQIGWEPRAEFRFGRTQKTGLKTEGAFVIDLGRRPGLFRTEGPGRTPPRASSAPRTPPIELTGDTIRSWIGRETEVPIGRFLRTIDDKVAGSPSKTALDILDVLTNRAGGQAASDSARTVHEDILDEFARAMRDVASGEPSIVSPTVLWHRDASGRLRARLSPVQISPPTGEIRRFESFNEAALFMFTEFWKPIELERRRRVVVKTLSRDLRRKSRAVARVRAEIEESQDADEWRRNAELLLAREADVPRGRSRVTVLDVDNTTAIEILLDPALTPVQNAQVLFRRARKAARKIERAGARLSELQAEIERLRSRADNAALASDDQLARLETDLTPPKQKRRGRADALRGGRFRTYIVSGGWEVLVGKSSRDNDILTHRVARPSDLWFHARQAAGSHVVLRRAGRRDEPGKGAILEAAAIAAYHSRAGKSSSVAVCYAEKRYVRRPRGAKAGLATVTREKVVMVEPQLPEE